MTKRRTVSGTVFACDCADCRATHPTATHNTAKAWTEARAAGWTHFRADGSNTYLHFCHWIHRASYLKAHAATTPARDRSANARVAHT